MLFTCSVECTKFSIQNITLGETEKVQRCINDFKDSYTDELIQGVSKQLCQPPLRGVDILFYCGQRQRPVSP